ncbi:pyridoxamine 5'-phosphate oxidase family protein [Roseococcus sp. YIM B11640]|uniref:pyridoxamine 5'-phosphate oxidase family protein n=1 Tax=Roseococcus sp. YIM B11640 TaxID=3133973 RepID=UPI003C7B4F36
MNSMFHDGMRELQDDFDGRGVADALEAKRKHREFWPEEIELFTTVPFFFIATTYGEAVDCSFRGGAPGFVKVVAPSVLEWPEYDGNSMYRTLGNIIRNPRVGLLFIRFDATANRTRLTGNAALLRDAGAIARHPGAKAVVRFEADYVYPNCPRYIPEMRLVTPSPHPPAPGHAPPPPAWKARDYIRDVLPADDVHRDIVGSAEPSRKL